MSIRLKYTLPAFLPLRAVLFAASPSFAGWQSNVSYGGTLKMDLYTPSKVAASPAVLVAIHFCTGNSGSTHGWFDSLADKYGFYIISPDAGKQCFDSSATRDGDKAAIVKMVQYVLTEKNADKTRVFSVGASSGGCMTNTLLGIYPDVFARGSALPGVPVGSWTAGDIKCSVCGTTPPNKSAKEWGDAVRNAYAYTGSRPRVQQWVGTNDQYNFDAWLDPVVLQWTNVLNLGTGAKVTGPTGWTRTEYKDGSGTVMLQTNVGERKPHDLTSQVPWTDVVSYFGLDKATGTGGTGGLGGAGGATIPGGPLGTGATPGKGGAPGAGGTLAKGGSPSTPGGAPSKGGATGVSTTTPGGATGSAETTSTPPATTAGGSGTTGAVSTRTGSSGTGATTTVRSTGGSSATSALPTPAGTAGPSNESGGCSVKNTHRQSGALLALLAALATTALRRRRQK